MSFLGDDYLLETETARTLYEGIADLPIVDPHSHADVVEIVEDDGWSDVWEVEGATDHYVWALMRNRGVPEERITGDATNREKWEALAEVFPSFAGNPTYEWVHLDLKRRFGIDRTISSETADEIWEETAAQLEDDSMRPQALLREMDVEVVCSTDDPTSSLENHERAEEEISGVDVLPTWRADRVLQVEDDDWGGFVDELATATDVGTGDLEGFLDALRASHDHFAEHGCVASDVGIRMPVSRPVDDARAAACYEAALAGSIEGEEAADLQAYLLECIGELNAEKGWTTQFHLGPVRDYREEVHEALGPASGGDVSTQDLDIEGSLKHFLNRFDGEFEVVLYCLDPTHYPTVATLARVFPNVNVGPAWWFNDSPVGIEEQLEYVGTVELLSNSPGMVSDSRKLLSYGSRFEMFRRSLANVVGRQVERGRMPRDVARDLVRTVAYDRPRELYGF
ncbi:glucuronate isomerase [Halalkalicoccus tibetensis]|uniref:Uronate isomerase n=1 Tax=Halalkalicoccus tibetensis TaxID=175632 RepID=A0ABD5VAB2_9EURY